MGFEVGLSFSFFGFWFEKQKGTKYLVKEKKKKEDDSILCCVCLLLQFLELLH